MEITEVRIKLINNPEDRLRGFCSVTFDDSFVVRDLKIIEGNSGPFVAMPSRKLTDHCKRCRSKNHLRANFCNQCGTKMASERIDHDSGGRAKLYADVAHPVNAACREMIQRRVVEELEKELARAEEPGYSPRYDGDYFDEDLGASIPMEADKPPESPQKATEKATVEPGKATPGSTKQRPPSDASRQVRVDSAEKKPYKTHKPDDNSNEVTKSKDEDFGKGVFE